MIIDPDLHLLVPDPSPRSELDVFVSLPAYRRAIKEWQSCFQDLPEGFLEFLRMTFGPGQEVIERRCALYRRVLEHACTALGGETAVWLAGSPSRINWEGHHVDHQGGWYNATTDENEIVAVVAQRTDTTVRTLNIDPQFPKFLFSLNDRERVSGERPVWADYVKGSFMAVLNRAFGSAGASPSHSPVHRVSGADLVVGGDIPVGAGQSSSHALCVVSVLAAVAVNGLRLDKRSAVICAQEAEWFSGSRTGLGDQAAMIFARRDSLFSSSVIEEKDIETHHADFPPHLARVIVDSFTSHRLQGRQRLDYSGRVCAYRIAFPFLLDSLMEVGADPAAVTQTRYLADINPDRFPIDLIYRALLRIPCVMPLEEIRRRLGGIVSRLHGLGMTLDIDLDALLRTYFGEGPYPNSLEIRGIALYGLSECRRSTLFAGLLASGSFEEAGALVTIGHNGDRVVEQRAGSGYAAKRHDVSDEYLLHLLDDLASDEEDRLAGAQLERQSGEYRASHPFLDRVVDAGLAGGALCASLTGGGLGGVATVLVDQSRLESLKSRLMDLYRAEQERSIAWCDSELFAEIVEHEAHAFRSKLSELWSRKQRALDAGLPWQPTDDDRDLVNRLLDLLADADVPVHDSPTFQLLPADEASNAVRLNHSIDGAGFIHPPVRSTDHGQLWEERTTAALLAEERAALRDEDWSAIERVALQQQNVAYRRLRLARTTPTPPITGETFLVTGGAGFIGSHLCRRLLDQGYRVIVLDDFNDYYDPFLKYENIRPLLDHPAFDLFEGDFRDLETMERIFAVYSIDQIVHLGARAGVRPSIQDPQLYVTTNVLGTQNLLEMARRFSVRNFVYASSSSVYGGSKQFPFSESQPVDDPVSPYAATKKANEVQASCYHRLYGFPVTGLRFFTVYGPGGRPDMAIRKFIERLSQGKPVPVYGDGAFERDYTYIDDIVDGIFGAIRASAGREGWDEVINLGESETTNVRELILLIAKSLGVAQLERDAKRLSDRETEALIRELETEGLVELLPEQLGDVPKTYADISKARELIGYNPRTKIREGITRTVEWHREHTEDCPLAHQWGEAVRTYVEIAERAGLDSCGRQRDPLYTCDDLGRMLEIRDRIEHLASVDVSRRNLGLWLPAGVYRVMGDIAAYLRSAGDRPWGMTGLLVHRRRLSILDRIHAAVDRRLTTEEEERILCWSSEIIQLCGRREAALVVAAAGYGTRIADQVGGYERKHRLFLGDEMLLLSLRNMIPFTKRIVVVASENNHRDIAQLLDRSEINEENGFCIEYVIQDERLGDGDAHLTAAEVLRGFEGILLFLFADAPTKSPATISKMVTLKQALGPLVPLVVPCLIEERPYSPVVVAPDGPDRGNVLWNWQKADEEEFEQARQGRARRAPRNVGLFAAESTVFDPLGDYKHDCFRHSNRYRAWREKITDWERGDAAPSHRPKPPEFGFADLIKILASRGLAVAAPTIAYKRDRLNVNNSDDADAVRALYRRMCPQVRVEVEKREGKGEVIVRFVDLDADGNTVIVDGTPFLRNYTRFQFGQSADLSSPEVERTVTDHIRSLAQRIESEIGLRVLRDWP